MQPLEGFYYFTQVVDHAGFARAARALSIPKSRLSRHVVALEAQLGVRLIHRSTRRFVVTDVGQAVYRHARAMLAEADAAVEVVEFARAEPRGTLRISCPVALAQWALAPVLPQFLTQYPAIRLLLQVSNRRVDVLNEGFDVALRVRTRPSGEDGLVMRSFQRGGRVTGRNARVSEGRLCAPRSRPARRTSDARLRGRLGSQFLGTRGSRR